MKRVAVKLFLALGSMTLLYSIFTFYHTYSQTNRSILEMVDRQAAMALKFDLAIRQYVARHVRPQMYRLLGENDFRPEVMSTSFVARKIFEDVRGEFPDYIIKFSSDNPRNPVNQAGPEELEVIGRFNRNPGLQRWTGDIEISGKTYLAKFSARRMTASCLKCHGDPADAPASMIQRYGAIAGFHRPLGEVIGLDMVAIPTVRVSERFWTEAGRTLVATGAGLLTFFAAILLSIRMLITHRLAGIVRHFRKAAAQSSYADMKTIPVKGRDEISALAAGFNTLSDRLRKAYGSLENKVAERTRALEASNARLTQEIAERRRAEAALRTSEERYRSVFENTGTATIIVAPDTTIVMANDEFEQLTGYTKEEIEGRMSWSDVVHPEDIPRMKQYHQNRRHGLAAPATYEFRFTGKDGRNGIVLNKVAMIPDTGLSVLSVLDITGQKRQQEELLLTQKVMDQSSDAAFWTGPDGRLIYVNEAASRGLGYERNELLQMSIFDIDTACPEKNWAEQWEQIRCRGSFLFETRHRKKGGSLFPVEVKVNYLRFEDREYNCSLARNIVDRLQAEEEKGRLETRLRRAQKMEAVGTLAGGVAHDLNNILSAMVGYPDLLLMQIPRESALTKPIQTIRETGLKASAIVQDLLTLARRGVATTEIVNPNHIIRRYLESPEYNDLAASHRGVCLTTGLDPGLLNVFGSPVHLSKTVMNLVANAFEAMPDGGRVTITTENRYVDEPLNGYDRIEEGDYVVLTVTDSGVGISAEDKEKIFEPFYTRKVMGRSGTGLGMAVVWGTVKDHRGRIDVQSEPGRGATFTLFFPATRKTPGKTPESLSVDRLRGNGQTVLVVDDVAEQREIATAMLSTLGYAVLTVDSGEAAVRLLSDRSVDLVVLDMIMAGGMDGMETYRRIIEIHPGQRAVIASGFSETDRVRSTQKLGAGEYLRKPYTLEKIGLAVKRALPLFD